MTSVTVTQPLKEYFFELKSETGLSSLNDVILYVLHNDIAVAAEVEHANTQDDPGVISISDNTLELLQKKKKQSQYNTYDDFLRAESGATEREQKEKPIEWEPLDA